MITIRNILAIPDGKEPSFIPNQEIQENDSSSESKAEYKGTTLGKDLPQSKVQALAAKGTTLKSSETKETGQDKEIKETKEAPPELQDGG